MKLINKFDGPYYKEGDIKIIIYLIILGTLMYFCSALILYGVPRTVFFHSLSVVFALLGTFMYAYIIANVIFIDIQ